MTSLQLIPGDTFTYSVTVRRPPTSVGIDAVGAPYDLTGCKLQFAVKRRNSDPQADEVAYCHWADGGASAGIAVADPLTGEAVITIDPTVTLDFVQAAHYWDLQLITAAGQPRTVDSGRIVVRILTNQRAL